MDGRTLVRVTKNGMTVAAIGKKNANAGWPTNAVIGSAIRTSVAHDCHRGGLTARSSSRFPTPTSAAQSK
ncbi:hypothetical protein GCM10009534_35300 [Kribbella sandramycini]